MIIGVVGGMGSYATLHFFKRYLEVFPAEKEWDRPRIIIDNRCTMPSRVRAVIYNERYGDVVDEISDSISYLGNAGCDYIVLACNTSHIFLDDVKEKVPNFKDRILNIIELCAKNIVDDTFEGDKSFSLVATEGTIDSGIYQNIFGKYELKLYVPSSQQYSELRYFIEAVKQDKIDDIVLKKLEYFAADLPSKNLVLGCTEFPVLIERIKDIRSKYRIYDPLESVLEFLHQQYICQIE